VPQHLANRQDAHVIGKSNFRDSFEGDKKMELSKEKIVDYLYNSNKLFYFYKHAMNIGFWPDFPRNEASELAHIMEIAGISELSIVDKLLEINQKVMVEYISHILGGGKYKWRATLGWLCGLVLIVRYSDSFSVEKLIELDWAEENAITVMAAARLFGPRIS
jgi:hypothetical protein